MPSVRRTISCNIEDINTILDNSSDASQLIVEAMLYFLWAVQHGEVRDTELIRLFKTGVLKIKSK